MSSPRSVTRPVVPLATIDPIDREVALLGVLADRPDVAAVVHDIVLGQGVPQLRRRVLSGTQVLEDNWVDIEHVCPSCAMREDAGTTVARLLEQGDWAGIVVALPPGVELIPAAAGLTEALAGSDGEVAGTVAYVSQDLLPDALLGEAQATDTGIGLAPGDDRSLAEVALGQLSAADLVILDGGASGRARDLADAVRRPGSQLCTSAHDRWLAQAFAIRYDLAHAEAQLYAPSASPGVGAVRVHPDEHGWCACDSDVWALDLRTPAALHPARLLEQINAVANGPRVLWGRFWVPNRPDSVCGLYGGGRQVSVGVADTSTGSQLSTRLIVVGAGPGRDEVLAAFERARLTEEEERAGLLPWLGQEDPLEPYLGERSA